MKKQQLKSEPYMMNRELSWLKFNERVLEEAENPEVPLCERMTFVSIYQSNLDEFFRVRVGSLQDQMLISTEIRENKTKMTSAEQIRAIIKEVKKLNQRKDKAYEKLMKKIEEYGITLINHASAKSEEKKFLEKYFMKEIMPLSSPTIVGKRQPFPFLKNGEIYAVVVLETRNKKERLPAYLELARWHLARRNIHRGSSTNCQSRHYQVSILQQQHRHILPR